MQTGKHDKRYAGIKEPAITLAILTAIGLIIGIIAGAYIRWMPLDEEEHGWQKTVITELPEGTYSAGAGDIGPDRNTGW